MNSSAGWPTGKATENIRSIAKSKTLEIAYTSHAKDQMQARGLIVSDVLYALRGGFVLEDGIPASRPGFFRYKIVSKTPNSGSRSIGVVTIPNLAGCHLKIVTVMWIDEFERRDGSIIGEKDE